MNQASPVSFGANVLSYEEECNARINAWHSELKKLADEEAIEPVQKLKAVVETELAIAELKIKTREADHAKWVTLFVPTLTAILGFVGAIVGALIGGMLRH
jgi:hypothetical protein